MYNAANLAPPEVTVSDPIDPLANPETRSDLRAAISARHELGPDMEDHIADAFLARLDGRIQQQVARQISAAGPMKARKSKYNPPEVIGTSFGIGIPLIVVAGIFGGAWGVLAVILLVALVNVLLYLDPKDRL